MKYLYAILLSFFILPIIYSQEGTGEFQNQIKIGPKTNADTVTGGMIQYSSNDFKGFDGVQWKSFLEQGVNYAHVITVALTGGDFATIQAGINACGTTSPTNPCFVRVAPGSYNVLTLTMKKYLHLKGAGKYSSTIVGDVIAADSCMIEGFYIRGEINCVGTSPKISSNIISNPTGCGIHADGTITSSKPWIENNQISHCMDYGIKCSGGPTAPLASNPWIIQNKIDSNANGGIICTDNAWPTISNNIITENRRVGILLRGTAFPTEPTITDNIISHTIDDGLTPGIGIVMSQLVEPRVMLNDIYGNKIGINIESSAQPSILSNNINYNDSIGIRCTSPGAGLKKVVIQANHLHSNGAIGIQVLNPGDPIISHNQISFHQIGIDCGIMAAPLILQNTIIKNSSFDIQYSMIGPFPTINLNVYDVILPGGLAGGIYNSTSFGGAIGP